MVIRYIGLLFLLAVASKAPSQLAGHAFVTDGVSTAVWMVDLATGDRVFYDFYDYPHVLSMREVAADRWSGTVVGGTANSLLNYTLFQFSPKTQERTPVSGQVFEGEAHNPAQVGSGPPLFPGYRSIDASNDPILVLLRDNTVLEISKVTGDRRVLYSPSTEPPGTGLPITEGVEVFWRKWEVLVYDAQVGLVRIDRATGERRLLADPDQFRWRPEQLEALPDGRIAHIRVSEDLGSVVSVFDPGTGLDDKLTGTDGHGSRGAGPDMELVIDIAVADDGTVLAYDYLSTALFAIDPKTGDRRIVSSSDPEVGSGPPLPGDTGRARLVMLGTAPPHAEGAVGWMLK